MNTYKIQLVIVAIPAVFIAAALLSLAVNLAPLVK